MLKGGGWGGRGLVMMHVFEIVKQPKSNRKATEKKTEKLSNATLSMFFFVFCFLFFGFFGDREMYRNAGLLACKNRAKGVGVGRVDGFGW